MVLLAVAVVVAAATGALPLQPWATLPSAIPLPASDAFAPSVPTAGPQPAGAAAPQVDEVPRLPPPRTDGRGSGGAFGEADGVVSGDVTVFDDDVPAVANLDTALLDALREAATAAAGDGIRFSVNSGWRSSKYQEQLLHEAVAEYGSEGEAARWVATPETSLHVSGDAVDIGPTEAAAWLFEHGADHGLCQVYRNEPWHVELRPDAAQDGCPPLYADPTHDPRMQQ